MNLLGDYAWILGGVAILAIVGLPLVIRYNNRKKSVERKWTDPKFHQSDINR